MISLTRRCRNLINGVVSEDPIAREDSKRLMESVLEDNTSKGLKEKTLEKNHAQVSNVGKECQQEDQVGKSPSKELLNKVSNEATGVQKLNRNETGINQEML